MQCTPNISKHEREEALEHVLGKAICSDKDKNVGMKYETANIQIIQSGLDWLI